MADRRPLIDDSSEPSETANNTPALPALGFSPSSHSLGFSPIARVSPPSSPLFSRPGYARLQNDATAIDRHAPSTVLEEEEEVDIADNPRRHTSSGLGIASPTSPPARRVSVQTIPRRPVPAGPKSPSVSFSPATLSPPGTGNPLLGGFPSTPDLTRGGNSPDGGSYEEYRPGILKNTKSSTSFDNDYQRFLNSSDTDRLRRGAPSVKSAYETGFRPTDECPTTKDFYQSRFTWVSITIIIICLFSTVFSGIFLGLALRAPRYGRQITSHGPLKPADAILLTSVFAKLIELSFVTSFVAFLGQVLSRRAFMKEQGRGVTLSELSMWRWVVQPGTLITHWETAKYAGISILGILSLLSAILATLYTSAATALVQPMLKNGRWGSTVMVGQVKTVFANINYMKQLCETPITPTMDPDEGANTCLQIEHAGQGYHNYQRYLSTWKQESRYGNGTSEQSRRPLGFGLLYENTTVTAQWINIIDTKEESKKHGRAINSVSLAMPHSGVFSAARDQRNDILQPEELSSEGTYSIRASVPSPVINVLCVNMNGMELKPIVYNEWPYREEVTINSWDVLQNDATTMNETVVDDIFRWTKKKHETGADYPPVFAKLPKPFNTVMNHTSRAWGRESIYLLGAGGPMNNSVDLTDTYTLCRMHVTLTAKCATQYNATGSGGTMETLCEDRDANMSFINSNSSAPEGLSVPDWRDVGFDWSNSLSLNTGIMDGKASNSRLLTQLILHDNDEGEIDLDPSLPSPAEALAVMSGCTLLMSGLDAPFVMDWNYTHPLLEDFQSQYFNASVIAQQYASGGVDEASKGWIIILLLVFLMNIFVLIYFLFHKGLVTDFSEPPNLFALAVNSPPSHLLAGSCGGGPEGKQYMVNWFVNAEGDHLYMEPGQKPVLDHSHAEDVHPHTPAHAHGPNVHVHPPSHDKGRKSGGGFFSGITNSFNNLRQKGLHFGRKQDQTRMRPVSVAETDFEMEDGHTKTQRQYAKLAKRRSML